MNTNIKKNFISLVPLDIIENIITNYLESNETAYLYYVLKYYNKFLNSNLIINQHILYYEIKRGNIHFILNLYKRSFYNDTNFNSYLSFYTKIKQNMIYAIMTKTIQYF